MRMRASWCALSYRARSLGSDSEEIDWSGISRHLGRLGVPGREGKAAQIKYWALENAYLGEGTGAGRKNPHRMSAPIWLMTATALEQLVNKEGAVADIVDRSAALPAFAGDLDWSVRPGSKAAPRHDFWVGSAALHIYIGRLAA
ncbi:hypothetical protein WJX72_006508 [[Myrmecia] bisecta]|uniref:Uncharacterized protein n=1 Tax=[Myrmecia] bisecta TaxID=41462 RepID=A0AAW1PMX2_9CHLO